MEVGPEEKRIAIPIDRGKHTTLCGNNATLLESSEEEFKVWLLEQALCWSLWVRGVSDDDVKLILVVVQELETISNVDLDLGVLVADGHARQILLRETDDSLRLT
jgi:hypothetical protein